MGCKSQGSASANSNRFTGKIMINLIEKRAFWAMQYGFYRLMWFTGYIKPEFRQRLSEKNFTMQMKTSTGYEGRYFTFLDGNLLSSMKNADEADFCLVWENPKTGRTLMSQLMIGKPKVLLNAVMDGSLKLTGEAALVAWFLETMNQLSRIYSRKRQKKK